MIRGDLAAVRRYYEVAAQHDPGPWLCLALGDVCRPSATTMLLVPTIPLVGNWPRMAATPTYVLYFERGPPMREPSNQGLEPARNQLVVAELRWAPAAQPIGRP